MPALWRLYRARFGRGLMDWAARWLTDAGIIVENALCSAVPASRAEAKTRGIGTKWLRSASSCLLAAPSAIVPEESNFVLNAQHPDASLLKLVRERRFAFDSRLL